MAKTRNQAQIVQDVVRYSNILNDLIDVVSYKLRRLNPDTGEPLLDNFNAIKTQIEDHIQNANIYYNALVDFINKVGTANVREALLTWDVDAAALKSEIDTMKAEGSHVWSELPTCNDFPDLIPLADRLDVNVPKLILLRRRWNL